MPQPLQVTLPQLRQLAGLHIESLQKDELRDSESIPQGVFATPVADGLLL
jgi:hypothetical protein